MLSWLWRIALVVGLFRPCRQTRPRVGAFTSRSRGRPRLSRSFSGAFVLVTFAISAVIGSGWAHELVYHGVKTDSILQPLAALAVVWSLILLSPLLMFAPKLIAAKRQAKIEYGRLVGQQGRAVRQRWVVGDSSADEEALEPAGVGSDCRCHLSIRFGHRDATGADRQGGAVLRARAAGDTDARGLLDSDTDQDAARPTAEGARLMAVHFTGIGVA